MTRSTRIANTPSSSPAGSIDGSFGLRTTAPRNPVRITLDGTELVAERGEPVAAALVAAGKIVLARSPKFHRPRGPACFRGACDGCLARVDGVPNQMTCLLPAEDGMTIVSQNRLGPRELDLLRMTDWFFPEGMNHHELFAGVPGVQGVMQAFARRVAGLGKMPDAPLAPKAAERRTLDVFVVGAGPAGMAIATRLAERGRTVEVIDDRASEGGSILALGAREAGAFEKMRASFRKAIADGRVRFRAHTLAAGLYGKDLLVVSTEGAEIASAGTLVLACGAHDGTLDFENNDLPGIMSARAAGVLFSHGVFPGRRIVVVVPEGGGPFGASYAAAVGALAKGPAVTLIDGLPIAARGTSRVKGVIVRTSEGERELPTDALVIDAPRAPSYELAAQAGASLLHEPRGFVVDSTPAGVYAIGEVAGTPFDAAAIEEAADRIASSIV